MWLTSSYGHTSWTSSAKSKFPIICSLKSFPYHLKIQLWPTVKWDKKITWSELVTWYLFNNFFFKILKQNIFHNLTNVNIYNYIENEHFVFVWVFVLFFFIFNLFSVNLWSSAFLYKNKSTAKVNVTQILNRTYTKTEILHFNGYTLFIKKENLEVCKLWI